MDFCLCLLVSLIAEAARFSRFIAGAGIGPYEEWTPGKKRKILLVGYNGARNTGSDVRVAAIARQIGELFGKDNVHITVMTLDAASLAGYFDEDVELLPFSSLFPWDLYRACSAHHAAILCEGSTLKSTFANALTLFMAEAAGIMNSQKKPCLAYGSEVGTMEPFLTRAVKKLCRNTYFITRTKASYEALTELGLKGHAGTDAAWTYDGAASVEETERMLRAQGWDGKKPLLGVAVIDPFCWPVRASLSKWIRGHFTGDLSGQYDHWYFFSDSPARRAAYRRYIAEMARGVNAYLKKSGYFPVLIGMEKLDARPVSDLRKLIKSDSAVFLSGEYPAGVMTGVLRRLSALVTSRYHAAVLSMETACPIAAVSMDERLDSIMKELSLDREYLLHVSDEDLGRKLYRALRRADAHREPVTEKILRYKEESKEKLALMGVFMKAYLEKNAYLEEKEHLEKEAPSLGGYNSTDRRNRFSWNRTRGKAAAVSGSGERLCACESGRSR